MSHEFDGYEIHRVPEHTNSRIPLTIYGCLKFGDIDVIARLSRGGYALYPYAVHGGPVDCTLKGQVPGTPAEDGSTQRLSLME